MTKLKPCPFCGGEAEIFEAASGDWVRVICHSCGAGTDYYDTETWAVEYWNMRKGENLAYAEGYDDAMEAMKL